MQKSKIRRVEVAAVSAMTAIVLTTGTASTATAAPGRVDGNEVGSTLEVVETDSDPSSVEFEVTQSNGQDFGTNAIGFIRCRLDNNNPHYSGGTGGVIYKVRGSCQRYGVGLSPKVVILMSGQISLNGNFRAGRVAEWTIPTDGSARTWYVPAVGSHAGSGCGKWKGTSKFMSSVPGGIAPSGTTFSSSVDKCLRP
jgi:hypothetical protein